MVHQYRTLPLLVLSALVALSVRSGTAERVAICVDLKLEVDRTFASRLEDELNTKLPAEENDAPSFLRAQLVEQLSKSLKMFRFIGCPGQSGGADPRDACTWQLIAILENADPRNPWPRGPIRLAMELQQGSGGSVRAEIPNVRESYDASAEPPLIDHGTLPWLVAPLRDMVASWDENAQTLFTGIPLEVEAQLNHDNIVTDLKYDDIAHPFPPAPPQALFRVMLPVAGHSKELYFLPCDRDTVSGPTVKSYARRCGEELMPVGASIPAAQFDEIFLWRYFR